jgi:DNA-binding NarL/FixJ family response regulator
MPKEAIAGSALIVEDHPLYRDALTRLVTSTMPESRVVAANSAEAGLRVMATLDDLLIVVMDPGLPGITGTEAITAFRTAAPHVPVVAISASEDRRDASAALRAGARVFISKAMPTDALAEAIRRVLDGRLAAPQWISPAEPVADDAQEPLSLTARQREILGLIVHGHSNKEIALRLVLAEATVKMHVSSIFRALNVASRTQCVRAASRLGVLS